MKSIKKKVAALLDGTGLVPIKNECVEEVLKEGHFVFTEEAVDEESFVEFTRRVLDKALHNENIIKSIKQCIIFSVPKRHIAMFGIEEFEPLSGYLSNWAEGEAEYIWGIYGAPDKPCGEAVQTLTQNCCQTIHEEWYVFDSFHLCTEAFDL